MHPGASYHCGGPDHCSHVHDRRPLDTGRHDSGIKAAMELAASVLRCQDLTPSPLPAATSHRSGQEVSRPDGSGSSTDRIPESQDPWSQAGGWLFGCRSWITALFHSRLGSSVNRARSVSYVGLHAAQLPGGWSYSDQIDFSRAFGKVTNATGSGIVCTRVTYRPGIA